MEKTITLPNGERVDRNDLWMTIVKAKIKYNVVSGGKIILGSLPPDERKQLQDWATAQTNTDTGFDFHIWAAAPLLHASASRKPKHANTPDVLCTQIQTRKTGKGIIF